MPFVPRAALLLPVTITAALAVAGLAGCSDSPGEVSFSSGGHTATTGPLRSCDLQVTECESDDHAVAVLDVPAGRQIRIAVPDSVAKAPWQVVFRYRGQAAPVEGRTEVFAPGSRHDFTLRVPPGMRLETIEVQQYGAPATVNGQPSFRIRSAWVLNGKA